MRTGYLLAQELKKISTPNNNDRLARSLALVNAVAFSVPLTGTTVEECIEEGLKTFNPIASSVGENISIDMRLAQALFSKAVKMRWELVYGVKDPSIVMAALRSHTAEDAQNPEGQAMTEWLTSRQEFALSQRSMGELVGTYLESQQAD